MKRKKDKSKPKVEKPKVKKVKKIPFKFKSPICKKKCKEKGAKLCYANHKDSYCVDLIREVRLGERKK